MSDTFDLRIKFTGLCLLVPDTRVANQPLLHVLLPNVEGHDHAGGGEADAGQGAGASPDPDAVDEHAHHGRGGGAVGSLFTGAPAGGDAGTGTGTGDVGVDEGGAGARAIVKHVSRLIYDTAYETSGKKELAHELACRELRGSNLKLIGMGEAAIETHMPSEVADLGLVVEDKARLATFLDSDSPGPELAARVTMDRGAVTDYLLGVQASLLRAGDEFPTATLGDEPRLTTQVEWTIRGIEGKSLALSLGAGLNGAAQGQKVTLFPIGRTIIVQIWNVPEHELPGAPPPDEDERLATDHFAAFYTLVDAVEQPLPRLRGLQFSIKNGCVDDEKRIEAGEPIAPGTLMCMNGTVKMP
jgi:hypothetical protein